MTHDHVLLRIGKKPNLHPNYPKKPPVKAALNGERKAGVLINTLGRTALLPTAFGYLYCLRRLGPRADPDPDKS